MTMSELPVLLAQLRIDGILGAILVVVASAAGAFGGAYLRRRAENLAMRENFSAIRKQLRTTTRDTEEIKQQLSGQAWRSQQQWSARKQYYSMLLTHLHHFKLALDDLSAYYLEPDTEHIPDCERGEQFHRLLADAASSYAETQKLLGPAAIYLPAQALNTLNHLFNEHWNLASFDAICTADYVSSASKLASAAYEQALCEAKEQLGVTVA